MDHYSKHESLSHNSFESIGSETFDLYLRAPYLFYEKSINERIKPKHKVLELGAGTGIHTFSWVQTGAEIVATDISNDYLEILKKNSSKVKPRMLTTKIADMEQLPFENKSFDFVVSAGSLSYGDSKIIDSEIRRVLRDGGYFICVDSLNNNPIYRFNRYIHVLMNNRSKITLANMPTISRINAIRNIYNKVEIEYFGCITFLAPILIKFMGDNLFSKLSDYIDKVLSIKYSAFKFVLIAKVWAMILSFFYYKEIDDESSIL